MGNFLGGDEDAKNTANEIANMGADISSAISLDSTIVCGNINEVNIQEGCKIIDSKITQEGSCTINNKSTQNSTINNAIKQKSKQSLAQIAKAEGQNFSLNFGNINATNIGSESVKTQGSISNKINSSCTSDALNKNLVNCSGGDLIHSQINQRTASNINQECVQKTNLTNALSQEIEQIIKQKATAVKKNTIVAILMAIAALILSVGVASKLGAGKIIRYILIFFCALLIIIIIAIFAWNMISSKDFNPPHGIQKENTEGDYCPDLSLFTHDKPRYSISPGSVSTGANEGYYHNALHCVASGGTWYNYEGYPTKGYSTTPWTGAGPTPNLGTKNWNPDLDRVDGGISIEPVRPQCLTESNESGGDYINQCSAINSAISSDLGIHNYDNFAPAAPLEMFITYSPNSSANRVITKPNTAIPSYKTLGRDYTFYRNKCLDNKCMWTPEALDLENDAKTGLDSGILTTDPDGNSVLSLKHILSSRLPEYSYAQSTDDGTFNSPGHIDYAPIVPWHSNLAGNISDMTLETIEKQILPIAKRYDSTITASEIKKLWNQDGDKYITMEILANQDKKNRPYTLFPFCTGGRSLQEEGVTVVNKVISCDKKRVESQRK